MKNLHFAGVIALLSGAVPCGSQSAPARQASDTTVIVAGPPRYPGIAVPTEELVLGSADGPTSVLFAGVVDIAVDNAGSIYVVEATSEPLVRQFDSTGRFVRAFGRRGTGPGEYTRPSGIGVLSDGRVLVYNSPDGKINAYSRTGQFLAAWRATTTVTITSPRMMEVDADDIAYVFTLHRPPAARGATGGPAPRATQIYIRVDPTGMIIDTVRSPSIEFPFAPMIGAVAAIPFGIVPVTRRAPGGYFITGTPSTYSFEIRKAPTTAPKLAVWKPGDPIVSVRRAVPPVPILSEERADWITNTVNHARGRDPGFKWDGAEMPHNKPAYRDIQIGRDGRIWVQIYSRASLNEAFKIAAQPETPTDAAKRWVEPIIYDVFEPDGRYLGQVRFPHRLSLPVMRGGVVWATVQDPDTDEWLVKRYRLPWTF